MYIRIDVGHVPPVVEVAEQDEFSRFHVVVAVPSHSWVDPDALISLAERSGDAAWREKLAGMVQFAERKGWLDAHGRIKAHVEVEQPG